VSDLVFAAKVPFPVMVHSLASLARMLAVLAFFAHPAAASDACIEDWSTAVPIVKEERLATVETITKLAKVKLTGDIVKVTLCKLDERYVYRLLMRHSNGKVAPVIVDAREPFGR
jgi:hypothetical protein